MLNKWNHKIKGRFPTQSIRTWKIYWNSYFYLYNKQNWLNWFFFLNELFGHLYKAAWTHGFIFLQNLKLLSTQEIQTTTEKSDGLPAPKKVGWFIKCHLHNIWKIISSFLLFQKENHNSQRFQSCSNVSSHTSWVCWAENTFCLCHYFFLCA